MLDKTPSEFLGENPTTKFVPALREKNSPGYIFRVCPACRNETFQVLKWKQDVRMSGGAGINIQYQIVCQQCNLLIEGTEEMLMFRPNERFMTGRVIGSTWTEDGRFFSRLVWFAKKKTEDMRRDCKFKDWVFKGGKKI